MGIRLWGGGAAGDGDAGAAAAAAADADADSMSENVQPLHNIASFVFEAATLSEPYSFSAPFLPWSHRNRFNQAFCQLKVRQECEGRWLF